MPLVSCKSLLHYAKLPMMLYVAVYVKIVSYILFAV